MKYAALGVVGALLCGCGVWYVLWSQKHAQKQSVMCAQVITTAIHPETGEERVFQTPCDVPPGWQVKEGNGNDSYRENGVLMQRFRSDEYGFAFAYRQMPDGYVLATLPERDASERSLSATYTIIDAHEYALLQESTDARESPPAIAIQVYENTAHEPIMLWLEANPERANYHLKSSSVRNESVGGAAALRYSFDGLYQNEAIVISHKDHVLVFMGSFNSFEDPIRREFLNIVGSLAFF